VVYLNDMQYQMECKRSQAKLMDKDKYQNTENGQIAHIPQTQIFFRLKSVSNPSRMLKRSYRG
jgi:5'(3')-deoxyribonucleotidase